MKQLVCEMCGSTDLLKKDGVFVCQTCGTKYSIEEAKKMMVEGTVKIDETKKLENYLSLASAAFSSGNYEKTEEYCEAILLIDANNAEAWRFKREACEKLGKAKEAVNCLVKEHQFFSEDTNEGCLRKAYLILQKAIGVKVDEFRYSKKKVLSVRDYVKGIQDDSQDVLDCLREVNRSLQATNFDEIKIKCLCKFAYYACVPFLYNFGDTSPLYEKERAQIVRSLETFYRNEIVFGGEEYFLRELAKYSAESWASSGWVWKYDAERLEDFYTCIAYNAKKEGDENTFKEFIEKVNDLEQKIQECQLKLYWEKHAKEKLKLERKLEDLKTKNGEYSKQIKEWSQKRKQLSVLEELRKTEREIEALEKKKQLLGFFKFKEKKVLKEKISALIIEKDKIQVKAEREQQVIDKEINSIKNESNKILSQIEEIKKELVTVREEI